jgi:hypothetical protein
VPLPSFLRLPLAPLASLLVASVAVHAAPIPASGGTPSSPARASVSAQAAALATAGDFNGTWKIDLHRSTELSPWKSLELTFEVQGNRVVLHRAFAWGRRTFRETLDLDLTREVNRVSTPWWPDNRHLGAYSTGDQIKRVHAMWLDGGRLLRLSSDLTLETQQGNREVNILSDYKLSANGAVLTLTELRSTRNRPIVYVFTRVTAAPASAKP